MKNVIICKNCNGKVHNLSSYCPNCGNKVERPLYKNYALLFCIMILVFTMGKRLLINNFILRAINETEERIRKERGINNMYDINITELENFLNSLNPLEVTPDVIKDFLTTDETSVQS